MRHVTARDLLGQSLDDGGLADTGLADQDGVVLGAAAEHLLQALELDAPSDERVELILDGGLAEVAAELGKKRRLLGADRGRLFVEELNDVLADTGEAHPLVVQDGRGHRAFLAQDPKEQMLGANVGVQQPVGFFRRELEHPLGLGAEGNLHRGGYLLAEDRASLDFFSDVLEREVGTGENPARQALALANQPQQQVFRLDRRAAELGRFISREEQHSTRALRIAFKHPNVRRKAGLAWLPRSLYGIGR